MKLPNIGRNTDASVNIPLVFRNELWLKLPIAVLGHINLELPILPFKSLRGMTVLFIGSSQISLLIFSYPKEEATLYMILYVQLLY